MTITICILGWIACAIGTAWLENWRFGTMPCGPLDAVAYLIAWPVFLVWSLFP